MSENSQAATRPDVWWHDFTWPAIIVVLLGGHAFIVTGALLLSSIWIPGASTAPAGYSEALRWDELKASRAASERLGWSLQMTPTERVELNGDRRVEFVLSDADGTPVEGASLSIALYHYSRPRDLVEQTFERTLEKPGHYAASLRIRREGLWRLRATAERGEEHFLVEEDLWIGPRPEASS